MRHMHDVSITTCTIHKSSLPAYGRFCNSCKSHSYTISNSFDPLTSVEFQLTDPSTRRNSSQSRFFSLIQRVLFLVWSLYDQISMHLSYKFYTQNCRAQTGGVEISDTTLNHCFPVGCRRSGTLVRTEVTVDPIGIGSS